MTGILICSYNRPDYLRQCLESIKRADMSQVKTILIIDDHSTDAETIKIINDFELEGVELIKAFSKENRSIKGSLLFGCDLLFNSSDLVINLDGDAIVTRNFVGVLLKHKEQAPNNIITGFNCTTKNKDGSIRHPIMFHGEDYNMKVTVGGINMLFGKAEYDNYVRPALVETIAKGGNWDQKACLNSKKDNLAIRCCVPSVVQHIGVETSSMNHMSGGEPPDMAEDFIMDEPKDYGSRLIVRKVNLGEITHAKLYLPSVTLIAVDDNVEGIIKAADISCRHIEFESVKLLSSMPSADKRVIPIRHLGSKKEYSKFIMKEIVDYIDTDFFMTIQSDGWICDGKKWNDEWLNYDYCGSPWYFHKDGMQVGNGAASLRTRRLHQILKEDESIVPTNDSWIKECQEDHNICRIYRRYLEAEYDIKFAPIEVAEKFGIEAWGRPDKRYNGQFCFHGKNIDFSGAEIDHIPY